MFSGTRIRTYILVHDLAGYLREDSIFKEKSLYQRPNERVPFYIRKVIILGPSFYYMHS